MDICLSSRGWRSTSSTLLLNSGNSSRKSKPLWARLISPGWGLVPPPTIATCEIVWWGLRKGRMAISELSFPNFPATECILVVSRLSPNERGGRMLGMHFAIMDFPLPGEPIIIRLCPPDAATSNARFTLSCPFTSAKSYGKLLWCS